MRLIEMEIYAPRREITTERRQCIIGETPENRGAMIHRSGR
jgi:hypothetical protein